jgi:amino acid transporter
MTTSAESDLPVEPMAGGAIPGASGEAAGATSLKRDRLSMPEVLAQSVANAAPSAAMALLPLLVFLNAGNGTWISFVIAVLLMVGVGYCASHFAKRMTSAGGFYIWVSRSFGPTTGFIAGWGLQLGYISTGVATLTGFAIFGNDLLTHVGVPAENVWVWSILYIVDFLLPVTVAILDIGLSARTSLVLESLSIGIILFLCVAIFVHKGTPFAGPELRLEGVAPSGIVVGVVLAIFAFVGFESAGSLGMEARNPYRAVGRAILLSATIVGIFYIIVSYSQVWGFTGTSPGFAKSEAPMPDLANIVGIAALAPVIDIGLICGMFACTLACINAGSRMAFTMAHDGMGVPALSRTHRTRRTPHVAIWTVAIPMFAVPFILTLAGQSPIDETGWSGTVATFGFMLAYVLVSVAAPIYLYRLGSPRLSVWVVGIVAAACMVFVFWSSWLPQLIPGGLFPALEGVPLYLPYVFFAWMAAGVVWYLLFRARNPARARELGSRYESMR